MSDIPTGHRGARDFGTPHEMIKHIEALEAALVCIGNATARDGDYQDAFAMVTRFARATLSNADRPGNLEHDT